ncbi:ribonuclease H-like domain-containing protein [Tanacetum coccineum]
MNLKQSEVTEAKSSIEEPPELELKDLLSHLEYAFLEENNKLPVIIAKCLKNDEKDALLKVLKSHKGAIAWKITDIKGTPFVFSKDCIDAFQTLKKKLIEAPILVVPDWNLPFELMCDASDFAIGAVLGHEEYSYISKADEGFFVGYSLNSKAFRVFNSRTRIVEENLHIRFSESTPNVIGSGPDWLFDIDALTRTMNYEPIVAGTQSNGFAGTKASDNAGQARKETEPVKDYILLPLWTADPPFSQDPKSSHDDGSKPSSDDGKKVDEDLRKDSESNDQEKEDNVNSTNNVNDASTNKVDAVGEKTSIELPDDPNMSTLEDYSIFDFTRDDEDDGVEADMNNLDTTI